MPARRTDGTRRFRLSRPAGPVIGVGLLACALAAFLLPATALRARAADREDGGGAGGAGAAGRGPSSVAPLADHVPPHAVLYVGWHGANGLGPAYDGSHLKAVIDATDFKQLCDPFLPQLLQRVEQENKEAANAVRTALDVAKPMWQHPSAFVFAGIDWTRDKQPTPHLALLCQAGKDAQSLEKELRQTVEEAMKDAPPDLPAHVEVVRHGGLVAVVVGGEKAIFPAAPREGKLAASLATDEGFKSALGHVGKDAAFTGYVDFDRIRELINTAVDRNGDDQARRMWPKVRDATGFRDLHNLVWTSGFDGKSWADQAFIAAPAPRHGLLALCDAAPVSDEALKSIPQSATLAGAGSVDGAKVLDTIRQVAREVDPQAGDMLDQVLKQASDTVGLSIEDDLLKALGDEWVYYTDPRTGGRGQLGVVVVNKLKDARKAEQSLSKLETFANEQFREQLKNDDVKVSFQTTQHDGLTIHYLATPLLTPSWAIHEGNLYVALFPQVVAAAADEAGRAKGKSILDNKDFVALREHLGVEKATGLQFMDLPRTAPDAYAEWLMVSRASGFADLFGIKSPAMLAPPLSKLLPQLEAAGSASWVDQEGWHAKALSPFPGATALATDPMSNMMAYQPLLWFGLARGASAAPRIEPPKVEEIPAPKLEPPNLKDFPEPPKVEPPPKIERPQLERPEIERPTREWPEIERPDGARERIEKLKVEPPAQRKQEK